MKTIVFFNNKGGVGKTTLAYHLAHMLSRLKYRVLAADLDPQANLTSAFVDEGRLELMWEPLQSRDSILSAIAPLRRAAGDIVPPRPLDITDRLHLLAGDLGLGGFEDQLSEYWAKGYSTTDAARALRSTTAFYRLVQGLGAALQADVTLVDVGPNLGAINRAVLLAADFIVVPLAADLFSLQGLRNLGPTIRRWRDEWQRMVATNEGNADIDFALPPGLMEFVGYVVLQHAVRLDRPVIAYAKWLARIPSTYREYALGEPSRATHGGDDSDPNCLATLRNYRSLMPYAQEARKPMFDLKPADGAIGGHQNLVQICYDEFRLLAQEITRRCDVPAPE